ncbi:unnamed protein product [Effrenium voratum]|nr:unnamed protein product [Effrenium voratum]
MRGKSRPKGPQKDRVQGVILQKLQDSMQDPEVAELVSARVATVLGKPISLQSALDFGESKTTLFLDALLRTPGCAPAQPMPMPTMPTMPMPPGPLPNLSLGHGPNGHGPMPCAPFPAWPIQRKKDPPRMVHLKPLPPLCDRELLGWLAQLGVKGLTRISEEEVALEVADPSTIDGLLGLQGMPLGSFRLQVALDGRWPEIKAPEPEVCEIDVEERAKILMEKFLSEAAKEKDAAPEPPAEPVRPRAPYRPKFRNAQ